MNTSLLKRNAAVAASFATLACLGSAMAATDPAAADCSNPEQYRASSFEDFSGFSQARLNQQGNLIITIDQTADGNVDRIYRIHLPNAKQRSRAISRWSGREVEISVQVWTLGKHGEVHRFLPARSDDGFVVAFKDQACLEKFMAAQSMSSTPVYRRTAMSTHTPGTLGKESHVSVLDSFDEKGIYRQPPTDGDASRDPFFCTAGGPGAGGCSISFGGLGGIQAGSCSVSDCEAPEYACCGPGFGSNCTCVDPNDDDSGDDGNGRDDDNGGDDGGGGSGGGGGLPPGGGSGGDIVCTYDEEGDEVPGNPSECPDTLPNDEIRP